jgi:hypothetical protein
MNFARDLVYDFVNKVGDDMARYGPPAPYHKAVEAGTDNDDRLHYLLNWVGDDRAHAEAEKLRRKADELEAANAFVVRPDQTMTPSDVVRVSADEIDPYHRVDGRLVRKSDGSPVVS